VRDSVGGSFKYMILDARGVGSLSTGVGCLDGTSGGWDNGVVGRLISSPLKNPKIPASLDSGFCTRSDSGVKTLVSL
jgi:hypothetical protein